jgi:tetratricopeptide (TPR) repeat protein
MKKIILLTICALCITIIGVSCKKKQSSESTDTLTEQQKKEAIATFIKEAEKSVHDGKADFLNHAVDTVALKAAVAAKCTDIEAGGNFFSDNCTYGDYLCAIEETGGSFRFDTIYVQNGKYHVVLRTYNSAGNIQFEDLQLGFNHGKIVIEDAFLYSITANLSDKIASEIMLKIYATNDNPTDDARNMVAAIALCESGAYEQMWQLMNTQKNRLQQQFTDFYKFYTIGLHECSTNFTGDLEALRNDGADERFILYHQLCHAIRIGDAEAAMQHISKLIDYTGDDPIYWVLYAKALTNAKQYKEALAAYNTAKQGMDYIWDIWTGELTCYKRLRDTETFNSCLQAGKFLYGLSNDEIADMGRNF